MLFNHMLKVAPSICENDGRFPQFHCNAQNISVNISRSKMPNLMTRLA